MQEKSTSQPFLIQIYFVAGTLIGLVMIVIGLTTLVNKGLEKVFDAGYPETRVLGPYPPYAEPDYGVKTTGVPDEAMTEEQKKKLAEWEAEYDRWAEEEKNFDYQAQEFKRSLVTSFSLLIVGIPVFALHAPYVFKKKK